MKVVGAGRTIRQKAADRSRKCPGFLLPGKLKQKRATEHLSKQSEHYSLDAENCNVLICTVGFQRLEGVACPHVGEAAVEAVRGIFGIRCANTFDCRFRILLRVGVEEVFDTESEPQTTV